ncbi:MAPEG family protein [Afifella marina]|uniref:MAPEG family protein n=1 Tax=Afifella marina DSM 2698 TaxID=1120955 RepID=A0A1G5MKK5_AFIMA|nr:MAPEG family protein [Afifella marina]MBK1623763.1 hypothetical protein [Afifella marina DSM 2698]MBK1627321.1 hypothetical protein [Afifella marina]MBK5918650.1 hypothetical protein [Afifella marina]RAI22728.1 hypothetical protein CH311_03435 [Afifella marina DSM 2698]SCZ24910.1 hypothetical protein SAMN03080610_00731 [Afifella marina DSM 2698]
MPLFLVLLPTFIQVGLTFFLAIHMGRVRFAAIRRGEVKPDEIALNEPNWPAKALQAANCYRNQFELPVLFYALTALAVLTNKTGFVFVILSFIFVASRLLHAYIHIGSNELRSRFRAFTFGLFVLLLMWVIFALQILFAI